MRHVPNLLSTARLLAAPYVFVLLWTHQYPAALIWMFVIGLTDGFDGYIARRFNAASKLGAYLDPVADKVLLSGAFLTLGLTGTIPTWLVWLVLGRDVVILLFALTILAITRTRRDFPPTKAGKLSTAFQILYILTVTAAAAAWISPVFPGVLQWVVLAVTGWSSVDYALRAFSRQG
jgi:cardiolipin synthase (CMP-forming)